MSIDAQGENGKMPDPQIPNGPIQDRWSTAKRNYALVSPANKRNYSILLIGTGLAGASAAATLGELGYRVKNFFIQDSPRRAHSIAAQGGINAAKNYQNDGDSVWRLFHDTVKGGDFRARESNVYRLAELSVNIIDQAVAQGVPFARDYGGLLANRSFGGALVSRTFYARGQTGQQLLLGAYGALLRQVNEGKVQLFPRHEMLDLIIVDGKARGIVTRDLINGRIEAFSGDAVVLATGGYSNAYFLSTNAKNSNVTAAWRCYKRGAYFANPCFTQIHPTCIPVTGDYQSKLTLMSESLRNDGRVWVPKKKGDKRKASEIPEEERDYFLERRYPTFGNLVPRDVASRAAKAVCDEGRGAGESGRAVFMDFTDALNRLGEQLISEKYGNLFEMYERITGENPYQVPMRIYPALHYTMGGLWVDYHLMSNIPGLFVLGEANFSDHGANRLGASALMQGLADGYFIIPYTLGNYLAQSSSENISTDSADFKEAIDKVNQTTKTLLEIKGNKTVLEFHRELGLLLWEYSGMSRSKAGLKTVLEKIPDLRNEFWNDVLVPGTGEEFNKNLEFAGRVADFLEMGELIAQDALDRQESCGAHFREEYQTSEGEAQRNDQDYNYVAAWEYRGPENKSGLLKEKLEFDYVKPTQRSYK
jgi:succinate dehydrogenase / fumarate reductase flavoprotein subunit